jgi:imidazolonepropionase-like amidohydrolase
MTRYLVPQHLHKPLAPIHSDPTISMFRAYVSPPSYQAILTGFGRIVPPIRANGIRILAGSDLSSPRMKPGQSLHDELALLADAGFSPSEVLRAATSNATQFLGISDSLGTVQRGMLADLVLLGGNPLTDIRNTQRIVAVIQNGGVIPTSNDRKDR